MNYIKDLFSTLFSGAAPDEKEYYRIENLPYNDPEERYLENKKNIVKK